MKAKFLLLVVIVLFIVAVLSAVVALRTSAVNRHRVADGINEQVVSFRIQMWTYFQNTGRSPARLDEIVQISDRRNEITFGTLQKVPCYLDFMPNAKPDTVAARIKCGEPILAEFVIGGDGRIIREKWYPQPWFRYIWRERVSYPKLTTRYVSK